MKSKQRKQYPDLELVCELCGRKFKNAQGLFGHTRWVHGSAGAEGPPAVAPGDAAADPGDPPGSGAEGPLPSAPTASPGPATRADSLGHGSSVKELKAEVEALRLQLQRRKLQSEFPLPPARPTDVMEQSGLGEIDAEVKSQAQRRAFALPDEAAPRAGIDWLSLLNSPNLPAILQLLRGGLFGSDSGSGLGVLKDLGINLKDLLAQSSAPKAGSMTIAGVDFTGAPLTPDLLKSVLEFRAAEEKVKSDFEGRKTMADSLTGLVELLAPLIAGNGPGRAAGIAGAGPRTREPQRLGIECPTCGFLNELPANQEPGGTIQCQGTIDGAPCSASWIAEPATEPAQERKRRPITKVQVPELPKSMACDNCGQLLNIEGRALGSELVCPVCQKVLVLMSLDTPLEPEEPLTPEQKAIEGFNKRQRYSGGTGGFAQGA